MEKRSDLWRSRLLESRERFQESRNLTGLGIFQNNRSVVQWPKGEFYIYVLAFASGIYAATYSTKLQYFKKDASFIFEKNKKKSLDFHYILIIISRVIIISPDNNFKKITFEGH